MGNQKSKSIITSHSTHGRDAGKRVMNQYHTFLAFLIDLSKIQDTVKRTRNLDRWKLSVKQWSNKLKKITLTKWRKPSSIDTVQIGEYNWMIRETVDRWHLELTIKRQSHSKTTCTDNQKIIRRHSHHSIKTEDEQDAKSPKHVVKDQGLIKKIGWIFWPSSSLSNWWHSEKWDWKEYWSNLGTVIWF